MNSIFDNSDFEKKLELDITDIFNNIDLSINGSTCDIRIIQSHKKGLEFEVKKFFIREVYEKFYKRTNIPPNNLVGELSTKFDTISTGVLDFNKGWIAKENTDNEGNLVISKNGYSNKLALAGGFLTDSFPLTIGSSVDVRWRKRLRPIKGNISLNNTQKDSYYYFYGEIIPDNYNINDNYLRFYFHFNPRASDFENQLSDFIQQIIANLNKRFIPFIFKCLYEKSKFNRADTAVLYIHKKYLYLFIDFLLNLHSSYELIFDELSPMFTLPIARGLGFSEEPSEEDYLVADVINEFSYGIHRVSILARYFFEYHKQLKNTQKSASDFWKYIKNNKGIIQDFEFNPKKFFLNNSSSFLKNNLGVISRNILPIPIQGKAVETATLVGFKLCSEAIWDSYGRCSWISFDNQYNNYKTLKNDLLEGLAGIIIFLHHLYEITKEPTFKRHLDGALSCLVIRMNDPYKHRVIRNGYYSGDLMGLYLLKWFEKKKKFSYKKKLPSTKLLSMIDYQNPNLGLMDGLAGNVLALINLHKISQEQNFIVEAIKIASTIINSLPKNSTNEYHFDSYGIMKGASGISIALKALDNVTNKTAYQKVINELIKNEPKAEITNFLLHPNMRGGILNSFFRDIFLGDNNNAKIHFEGWKNKPKSIRNLLTLEGVFNIEIFDAHFEYNKISTLKNEIDLVDLLENINRLISEDSITCNFTHTEQGFIPNIWRGYAGLGYSLLRLFNPKLPSLILPSTELEL